jgi:hypothetical protein
VSGPTIASAALGAGHDGRAEVVVTLRHPNGAVTRSSVPQEAVARALDSHGLTHIDQLPGRPWTVLLAGDQGVPSTEPTHQ